MAGVISAPTPSVGTQISVYLRKVNGFYRELNLRKKQERNRRVTFQAQVGPSQQGTQGELTRKRKGGSLKEKPGGGKGVPGKKLRSDQERYRRGLFGRRLAGSYLPEGKDSSPSGKENAEEGGKRPVEECEWKGWEKEDRRGRTGGRYSKL